MPTADLHGTDLGRHSFAQRIEEELHNRGQTLAQAITLRDLYFRISLLGACNLNCVFCHNEGAPKGFTLDLDFAMDALTKAYDIGFRRIQFTGGEPLLHPKVDCFVREARKLYPRVGITTNGVYLQQRIGDLVDAGITNIHVSLQTESLEIVGSCRQWAIPEWLAPILELADKRAFTIRLNLPVPHSKLTQAGRFLKDVSVFGCDIHVFSILSNGQVSPSTAQLQHLTLLVTRENDRREAEGTKGRVYHRGYKTPSGFRCNTCEAYAGCKEQSRSLRLGADRVLRPCLASRKWDIALVHPDSLEQDLREAALLSIDYTW